MKHGIWPVGEKVCGSAVSAVKLNNLPGVGTNAQDVCSRYLGRCSSACRASTRKRELLLYGRKYESCCRRQAHMVHTLHETLQNLTTPAAESCMQWQQREHSSNSITLQSCRWRLDTCQAHALAHLMSATPMPAMIDTSLAVGSCTQCTLSGLKAGFAGRTQLKQRHRTVCRGGMDAQTAACIRPPLHKYRACC